MPVKHIDTIKKESVTDGVNAFRQVLIDPTEGPNFAMRRFIIEAGGSMPRHTNKVEHEQFVLAGRAIIGINNEEFEVQRGSVVFIPAGTPHWYQTIGSEPFEFICIVPNLNDEIIILDDSYPDTNG